MLTLWLLLAMMFYHVPTALLPVKSDKSINIFTRKFIYFAGLYYIFCLKQNIH